MILPSNRIFLNKHCQYLFVYNNTFNTSTSLFLLSVTCMCSSEFGASPDVWNYLKRHRELNNNNKKRRRNWVIENAF